MSTLMPSSYHWSPIAQRRFLAVLLESGSIGRACAAVSKSREWAYGLRRRSRGLAFATGWDAALEDFDAFLDALAPCGGAKAAQPIYRNLRRIPRVAGWPPNRWRKPYEPGWTFAAQSRCCFQLSGFGKGE